MAELRFNPLINDWVMIASNRQNRPQMPADWCPFCPGSGNVPENYDVHKYDNDFPALSQNPPTPDDVANDFFSVKENYGKCEVILFSPEHNKTLAELPSEHIEKIIDLWQERYSELSKDEKIKFIYIFENKGDVVGVTMPHPHGQIYGYGTVPKKIELMADSFSSYYDENGECLMCKTLREEKRDSRRIIFENKDFTVYLPFYTEYPYGIYIMPNRHIHNITELSAGEKASFAETIRLATGTLDNLFGTSFPYMMCQYNAPTEMSAAENKDWHFHVAFYPPMRSKDKQKFNASSETGAWAHCNPVAPEDAARELRAAYNKLLLK